MKTNDRCYLCESRKFKKCFGSVRDNKDIDILECSQCGLVFLSSFGHIEHGFYENSQMHGAEVLDVQSWLNETAWDDERRYSYLKSALPNCRILDFGCGAAGFLLKAKQLSSVTHGIELEARLKKHYGSHNLKVFRSLSEITDKYRRDGYDIITLFHVLEHIPDPKSILSELSRLLADDGQIVIEVPNADDALLTLYENKPFSNFTYWSCHLFTFREMTLKMLFDQAGLKVNYVRQIQRYPLSNHLYWLSSSEPGGHQKWQFMDSPELHSAYEKQLGAIGKCDTLMASVSRR